MAWGTIIASYLFLAGLSAGAFITSSYVARKYPEAKTVRKTGRLISPVLMGVSLLLLVIDAEAGLKNPLRFVYLLTNFNSVMTIGTYIISIFMVMAAYVAVMELLKRDVNKTIELVAVVFAVAVTIYTGFLIGVVQTVPLWNTAILPILFVVSALSTGIAASLLVATIFNKNEIAQLMSVKKIHLTLLASEVVLIFTMLFITASANESAALSVATLISGEYSLIFWLGLILIGLTLPIVIESGELLQKRRSSKLQTSTDGVAVVSNSTGVISTVLTESFVLVGGFILRFLILAAAVPITFI